MNYKNECPKCQSRDIRCNRHFGCAFIIFVFISIGIGLLMIPFLPQHCKCKKCGLEWKA